MHIKIGHAPIRLRGFALQFRVCGIALGKAIIEVQHRLQQFGVIFLLRGSGSVLSLFRAMFIGRALMVWRPQSTWWPLPRPGRSVMRRPVTRRSVMPWAIAA